MKKLLLMMVVAISLATSCKKDKEEVVPETRSPYDTIIGENTEDNLTLLVQSYTSELKYGVKTITSWTGTFNPGTGDSIFNYEYVRPTLAEQENKLLYKIKEENLKLTLFVFYYFEKYKDKPKRIGLSGNEIILRKINGKSYSDILNKLNTIGTLLVSNPNTSTRLEIEKIFKEAEPILIAATNEYFKEYIKYILDPKEYAKYILNPKEYKNILDIEK